jgi:hypothetical protein
MGKVEKGIKCNVVGCNETAVRSISSDKVGKAGLDIGKANRGYLCKKHYKEMKKKSKKDRMIDKWRYMA